MRLNNTTLQGLGPGIVRPGYNRGAVTPGIVHLGIGAFFRAHAAVAVDDCLGAGETGWGIVAASLRSPATRDALAPQDGLYTLAIRDSEGERLRVIGSIGDVIVAPEAPEALLAAMTDPHVNALGIKGVGEIGITGTAAAIANAVWHAPGIRVRNAPITLDKLLVS
jgi:fructuronate reductase